MFTRNGSDILTFRIYDGYGNCISEFTGTMAEWQTQIARKLPPCAASGKSADCSARLH